MQVILTDIFSIGTIIAHIFILFFVFVSLTKRKSKIINFIGENGMTLAFLVAMISTLASLYYSDIVGWEPCVLCWYQRIFMYSNLFIIGLALFRRNGREIIPYSIFLSVVGGILAIYHSFIQNFEINTSETCSIYSSISCSETYFTNFGYITIPMLSLTSFALMVIFLVSENKKYGKA